MSNNPASMLQHIDPNLYSDIAYPRLDAPIKWGSVTKILPSKPNTYRQLSNRLLSQDQAPSCHDVLIAQIVDMGRHTGIELEGGRKASLYLGDIVALAFGNRYATNQYEGYVPDHRPLYHMLSQGGVCGEVVSAAYSMGAPTIVRPLGYLADQDGGIANLRSYARTKRGSVQLPKIIVAVGSSMDAGKTTMASSIVHGLSNAGKVVHAGKLTGTACVKDLNAMFDAGASMVMDFNHMGFASTFRASDYELREICDGMTNALADGEPDFIVLEIADGVIQEETKTMLNYMKNMSMIDHLCLAVHDALAAPTCVEFLRTMWGITPTLVSGMVTISPLSSREASGLIPYPVLSREELRSPTILAYFEDLNSLPLHQQIEMSRYSVAVSGR